MRLTFEKHPTRNLNCSGQRRCDVCSKEEYLKKPSRWDICLCCERKDGIASGRRKQSIQVKKMSYINYCECCSKVFEVKSKYYQTKQVLKHCQDCSKAGVWMIGKSPTNKKHDRKDMSPRLKALSSEGYNEHYWRLEIIKRRKFQCEVTGVTGISLVCHHIRPFSKSPELQFDESNVVVITADLHKEFHIKVMGGWAKPYTKEDWESFVYKNKRTAI